MYLVTTSDLLWSKKEGGSLRKIHYAKNLHVSPTTKRSTLSLLDFLWVRVLS